MKNDLLLFFLLLLIFIILLFIGDLEINYDNLFLGNILLNKINQSIILGIGIFIYGKKIIDGFEKEKN